MTHAPTLDCQDEQRRHAVRAAPHLNGLDYLEVSDDQRTLKVYFLDKAPAQLSPANIRISGGRRIRDIQVLDIRLCSAEDADRDDCLSITVDKPGDFSTYQLCLVELDERGKPTDQPLQGFDRRYACLDFTFKVNCPNDLDCKTEPICPPTERAEPEINYLAKDYASFRQLMLDRLALTMPAWRERHVPDLGITLVEVLAYVGDQLSYYQDAVATEAYLDTAHHRISVRRHTRLVDYTLHEGCNARAWVCVSVEQDSPPLRAEEFWFITAERDLGRAQLHPDDLAALQPGSYQVFQPRLPGATVQFFAAHNRIDFYTWGDRDCCLPRGTTTATLRDAWIPRDVPAPQQQQGGKAGYTPNTTPERALRLKVGDVLIFEEVVGPGTGNPADADPTRRHAVRLTHVTPIEDSLYTATVAGYDGEWPLPLVDIAWETADALPFALCISTIGPAPECHLLSELSVARGNVVLVDHGKTVAEKLGPVPIGATISSCAGIDSPADTLAQPGPFNPQLAAGPLTFSQPLPWNGPARSWIVQDVRLALPQLRLQVLPSAPDDAVPLFTLAERANPDDLIARLKTASSYTDRYLLTQLAAATRQLLDEYTGKGPPSPALRQTFSADLERLTETWLPVRDLLNSGPGDRHFVAEIDDAGIAHLRFGDGEVGRQPRAGTLFEASYRVGNGPQGNVGAETIRYLVTARGDLAASEVRNPLPATGGSTPEPLAEAKLFAPGTFRSYLRRAITADDYAAIVLRDFPQEVQRAAATLRWTGSWYEVLVAIDPLDSQAASADLLARIAAHLHSYRRIGHDLVVAPAIYVPLDITLAVCVDTDYLRGHVKAELLRRFSTASLPDGQRGFFHPDNLSFGAAITLSSLVATAQAVPGVRSVAVTKLERLYIGPNDEIANGLLPLGPLEIARLDNDPNFPENGILRLEMRGGR